MEISFKTKEHPEVRTVNLDLPEDLQGLISKFGEETVTNAARGSLVISAQALGRRHIEKSQEELQAIFDNWDPNTRAPAVKKSAFERATDALGKMSDEEKAELLRRLKANG